MSKIQLILKKTLGRLPRLCIIFVAAMLLSVCCAGRVSASTVAEPDPVPLNEEVSGVLSQDRNQYYYIQTDDKDVNYEFVLKNNSPGDSRNFSLLMIEITVAQFHNNGKYEYEDYLINEWEDPTRSRTYKQTLTLKKNTKYIICLHPFYYEDTSYTLAVYQTARTPEIKKTTSKKTQVTVQFSKASSASYYEVAIKKKGGSWKTYTTKKNAYTFKKLGSKKTYSVRVRSVRKINGKKHYSAWTSISKIKTK